MPPRNFLYGIAAGQIVWVFWIAFQLVMEWERISPHIVMYCFIAAVQVWIAVLVALIAYVVADHLKAGVEMVKEDIAYWRESK